MSGVLPFTDFAGSVLGARLTKPQQVLCRVSFDGVDPCDLAPDERAIARELFGDVESIPAEARHVVAWLKGARMGGTWLTSLHLVYSALTVDVSLLARGEMAFAPIVAPDLKTARQALRFASGAAHGAPSIAQCIESESADGFVLRRPNDGRLVSVECLAASRGGASLRGRTMVSALMDESSFFRDADSGIVNDSELYRAVVVRVVPGGKLCVISTAWLQSGLLWQLVQANHGKPTGCVAAIAPTLLVRDDPKIRVIVEQERVRDPLNAAREFDCVPFDGAESSFFDPRAIASAVDDSLVLPAPWDEDKADEIVVGVGADFAFRSDSSALVVVQRDADDVYTVLAVEERRPEGGPLKPSAVCADFARTVKRYGCDVVMADSHYRESIVEHLEAAGLYLTPAPAGASGKVEGYVLARTLLHEGRLRLPNLERLLRQLRETYSRPLSGGGLAIDNPRWKSGGHGDLISALVLAVYQASRLGKPVPPKQGPAPGSLEWHAEREAERKQRIIERQRERQWQDQESDDWILGPER
jgi:hypothetical protein